MMLVINKSQIFEHFAGRSTSLLKRQIEIWLQTEANQELYFQWLIEWENNFPVYDPQIEEPLNRFSQYMESGFRDLQRAHLKEKRFLPSRWLAAAVMILAISTSAWFGKDYIQYQTFETGYGATKTVALPDGSTVTLNANSRLRVPRFAFGKRSREVFLKGEAYFVVSHKKDNMQFRVGTPKNMDVIVLGTEFNVYAREQDTRVMLHKGKVKINYPFQNSVREVMLKPGDLIGYNKKAVPEIKSNVETDRYLAWKEHRYIFEDMTLSEFGQLLTENYGLHVEIENDELASRTLVGSFKAENSEELLASVTEILNLKVTRKGNTILLQSN
ncbi:FecR family protein [Dyadobacter sp. CY323]|uniref:FecR family protein n=1 Tax=Dyadobacter sp. CY323 TaxID=2907302 RepID=UPI001F3B3D86|nr:FecR domain-containing protein [Dyadobacter sp. CY323]MCE6991407.1 FecR domain-containing protein [Dyadobacter sp. CY323]